MRILCVGAGGVGRAAARILARREFFEAAVIGDHDVSRARLVADQCGDPRFSAVRLDAGDSAGLIQIIEAHHITHVLNAVDPRFVMPVFRACLAAGVTYLDMAMSLSSPHPEDPFRQPGVKLGDEQFAMAAQWQDRGLLALVGIGVEPGLSDVFARYAADHLFSRIDLISVRDGGNLSVDGFDFAPTFSIWTTIEECLNPPVIYERGRGWYTTEPFSEPVTFDFPEGIGPIECVNVEHEEVLLIPRWIDAGRVDFKYGLGEDFITVLRVLHSVGLDATSPVQVGAARVAPRDVVARVLPDPAELGERMVGKTCAGALVSGLGKDRRPRETYLYHVVDNEWSMSEFGVQAVVWQTAVNPVVALELLAGGRWQGTGVLGPEALPAEPFLTLLRDDYRSVWGMREQVPWAAAPAEP